MNKRDRKKIENAVLYTLLAGSLVISPMGGYVVVGLAKYYFKKRWNKDGPYIPPERDPEQIRESLYNLKRKNYINWRYNKRKNIIQLQLTGKGKKLFGRAKFNEIAIPKPDQWDKKWRFFLFDVPEKSKSFREALREKLKALGFFPFQKSVWIYPFECENEMRYICEYMGIAQFTMTFTAEVENDHILRKFFYDKGVLPRKYLDLRNRFIRS
jgi:hypothetical protein